MYKKRTRRVNPSAEYYHNKFKFRQMYAEVNKIEELQHLVNYDEKTDLYSLNYIGLIPYSIQAIKELNTLVQTQQTLIEALQTRIEILENTAS